MIVNRQEELELATPERRRIVAEAVTAAVENFCANRGQTAAGRSASKPGKRRKYRAQQRRKGSQQT